MKDVNGLPRKLRFGSWVRGVFLVLSKFKSLRGTSFDPFAYGHERKLEVKFKKALISKLADPKRLKLNSEKFETQLDSALKVKGYGHIKRASLEAAILALQ
jgi:indolepyruvate ferredoxin oxidoreductase